MAERYTTEMLLRVFSDEDGYFFQVGDDSDALGCVELSYSDGSTHEIQSLTKMSPAAARAVANAMIKVADYIEQREKEGKSNG